MDNQKSEDKEAAHQLPDILNAKLKLMQENTTYLPNEEKQSQQKNTSRVSSSEVSTSDCSSVADSDDSEDENHNISIKVNGHNAENKIITNAENTKVVNNIDILQHVFNSTNTGQTFENISVNKADIVHIGNTIYLTGPIHITQSEGSNTSEQNSPKTKKSSEIPKQTPTTSTYKEYDHDDMPETKNTRIQTDEIEEEERVEVNCGDAFIGHIDRAIDGNVLKVIGRTMWLAQRPLEPYDYISGPVQYVIISHTASEQGLTQAENVFLVRHIQCFHIESCRWNDIAYNFLIGSDGNVYEGRGWGVVGAHTYGYNKKSLGISFIGCFMRDRTPDISLKACKLLIKRGIEEGHIDPNYKLIAHCQCSATESPGRMLFEEIKRWSHFCANPSP